MRYVLESTPSEFFMEQIEKNVSFLSGMSRAYILNLFDMLVNPTGREPVSKAFEKYYSKKPIALILEEALEEENYHIRSELFRGLGDLCLVLGGLYRPGSLSDDYIVYMGRTGYINASLYHRNKNLREIFCELSDKFSPTIHALRRSDIRVLHLNTEIFSLDGVQEDAVIDSLYRRH